MNGINEEVQRGSRYYTGGEGFEIHIDALGTASQVVGGGCYDGGVGFAIGVDRLVMAVKIGGKL